MNADPGYVDSHRYLPMRTGRKLGRTLYLVRDPDDPERDLCVGIVDTAPLADAIVAVWNATR